MSIGSETNECRFTKYRRTNQVCSILDHEEAQSISLRDLKRQFLAMSANGSKKFNDQYGVRIHILQHLYDYTIQSISVLKCKHVLIRFYLVIS